MLNWLTKRLSRQSVPRLPNGLADASTDGAREMSNVAELFLSSQAAHNAGRLDSAEAGYRKVISKDSRHAEAFHLLGLALVAQGEFGEAERHIRSALEISENAVFHGN